MRLPCCSSTMSGSARRRIDSDMGGGVMGLHSSIYSFDFTSHSSHKHIKSEIPPSLGLGCHKCYLSFIVLITMQPILTYVTN